jgi:hypothetical protein
MLVLMLRTTSVLSVALALFTTTACSSTSDPGEARREGTLTIHHGDDVHSTDCRGNEILRDAQGNPTLVQDDGELTAVCFENARLGISFGVQNFLELGPSFDLMNDERVSFYAEFPVGELDGSLSSRGAAEHRFQGTFDAAANRVVAKLTSSFAETTPQADLGTLGAPTSFELSIDFRAQ